MRVWIRLAAVVAILSAAPTIKAQSGATSGADSASEPVVVRGVDIERREGRERIVVRLSSPAAFRLVREPGEADRLEIRNATIEDGVITEMSSERGVIRGVEVTERAGRVRVSVRAEGEPGTAVRAGNRILWIFGASADAEETGGSRVVGRSAAERREAEEGESADVAAFLSDTPLQVRGVRRRRSSSARRIDLDLYQADVHNVLRLIAEVGGVNIVASEAVSGTVTVRLRGVPWDRALEIILSANGLAMVRNDNLVRVMTIEELQAERQAALAIRMAERTLTPIETRLIPAAYATAADIEERIRILLSDRGDVSVDDRTNTLIVRDTEEVLDTVEDLVRLLDTQTPQVLIEARVVETTSDYLRDIGIQWGGDLAFTSRTGNPTGLRFPNNITAAGGSSPAILASETAGLGPLNATGIPTNNPNFAVNLPAVTGSGNGGSLGLSLGSISGNVNLNVRLSAAESRGVIRIISSPRILTLDNHEAEISQGTLIPYTTTSALGVITRFQNALLRLKVRPQVTSDGTVQMDVEVRRDEPDFSNTGAFGEPTIRRRRAVTTLLVPDGHTGVIGGIYTRTVSRNRDQVPFFGDIPVLGALFRHRTYRETRSELVIFLTPRIVNRAESIREGG